MPMIATDKSKERTDIQGGGWVIALVCLAFVVVATGTVYFNYKEYRAAEVQHRQILISEVNEAASRIRAFIHTRQRNIETFAFERNAELSAYAVDPSDDDLKEMLSDSLRRWFPTYFAFTLADRDGNDLIDDIDGFVGPACQSNIQEHVKTLTHLTHADAAYETMIHPQANHYHFDVLAPWRDGESLKGVFFVSFRPDALAEILRSYQGADHALALVDMSRDYLIEVNAEGARDAIAGTRPINLTADEIAEIRASQKIDGSRWTLVGYLKPGVMQTAKRDAVIDTLVILSFLLLAGGLSIYKIARLAVQERKAVATLQDTNRSLAQMAEEQIALREAAEAGETAKAQFLASMSHEIRTPLNAVIGLTELVLKTDMTEYQRNCVSKVAVSGKNLLGLINDILDFSKIEAGKLEIEATVFDLDAVLDNVSVVVSGKVEENGNELVFMVDRGLPDRLVGDPLRLGQILMNLAGNAAKFTTDGAIVISVARDKRDGVDWLSVSVQDNGIGMTQEQSDKLFRPFVQADKSVTRTHGGTGLGLSICRELVTAMGGEIGVESAQGVGSLFYFRIPLVASSDATARATFKGIDPATTRVLVVDGNDVVRQTVERALVQLHFQVETAGSVDDCVSAYADSGETASFDVVLFDRQADAPAAAETISKIQSFCGTEDPVIFILVSQDAMMAAKSEFAQWSEVRVLQKPVNTSVLIDAMMDAFATEERGRQAQPEQALGDGAEPDITGVRVLLVEDNDLNQMVAVGVLGNAGCIVEAVWNGKEAVDKLREVGARHYDIVLMDIQMPEMDGLTATKLIREDDDFANLPVVAMTAHALDEERKRCAAAGMNDHITKPIEAREVLSTIARWTKDRRA